jgi:hypothetical protein
VNATIATGLPALRQALRSARDALAGGDPVQIVWTAIHNSELVINGLVLNERHKFKRVAKTGGDAQGKNRAAAARAQTGEQLWQNRWRELRGKHKHDSTVLSIIRREMENAGLKLPSTDRALRAHFPKKL